MKIIKNILEKVRKKQAFSLIEMSIVLLIIGIIIAGITQGSRLVGAFKLSTARNLTQDSPVTSIKNLALWLETTSEKSFPDTETENGSAVDAWYDINPDVSNKVTVTAATSTPQYILNCMNALPCLRFDGVANFMNYDGSFLANSDYTIFVVEQRNRGGTSNYLLGGSDSSANSNFSLDIKMHQQLLLDKPAMILMSQSQLTSVQL